jgi:Aspartate/tyrosine/aromatic aminotransferase
MANKYDILEISERAKLDKANGNQVINGCVGTFKDDNHVLISFPSVKEYLVKYNTNYLDYSRVIGPASFLSGAKKWFFNKDYQEITENKHLFEAATIGGTGAVYDIFKYYSDSHGVTIISDICWPNYFTIAKNTNLEYLTYPLFLNNKFNFIDLEKSIISALTKVDKVLLVINDPCQNPTGYSFSEEEYKTLFDLVNKYNRENKVVDLLFDIAYIDYSYTKPLLLNYLKKFYPFNIHLAFSCSKTFGIYGLRVGGLISFLKSVEEKTRLSDAIFDIARGSISSPNGGATNALSKLFDSDSAVEAMRLQLVEERNFLKSRALNALQIMNDNKIEYLPYSAGFFITIVTKINAYALEDNLEKMHLYVVPIAKNLVRIAICSLSVNEISLIAKAIRNFNV